jgi:PAS domain S-box-containing protein
VRNQAGASRDALTPDFRTLFESAPGLFLVLDPQLTIVAVTEGYLAATMTNRADIVGRGLFEVFPDNPDDPTATGVDHLRASLDRVQSELVADTMAVQKYDIRRPESDGGGFEERFWSPVNTPVLGADGRLEYIIHRVEDVTVAVRLMALGDEQQRLTEEARTRSDAFEAEVYRRAQEIAESNRELHRANAELQRTQVFLDSLIENLPDMVFVKDAATLRFVRFNRAGEELLGFPRSALIGKGDYDFFPKDEADAFTAKDREVLTGQRVVDIPEEPIETAHNGARILHTKKIPILDERGRAVYLLGISEDITERKQVADEILRARNDAELANLAKTEFLSRMSHELRTPLNAILGFSQLLEEDELDPEHHKWVGYITQAGRHLLGLINEVLDISRIETGQLTISLEPVSVEELIGEVRGLIQPMAVDRDIAVNLAHVTGSGSVVADRQRLKQVLLNLLSNAVKYNREGGSIAIGCSAEAGDRLRISVADTGHGISSPHIERLFRPFDRIGAEHGGVEGTGIGLALTKGLVDAMGGSIGVESEVGVGSTFWVELPRAESASEQVAGLEPAAPGSVRDDGTRRTILQVEDNVSNLRLVEQILASQPGIELVTTELGERGLVLARELRPDLILLDLHLPDISGHEVLTRLRMSRVTRAIPVVILSADATEAQVARLTEAGAFGYLTKPLDVSELLRTVDAALARDGSGHADRAKPRNGAKSHNGADHAAGSLAGAGRARARRSSQAGVSSPTA